jgi:hypothetical protein
LKYLKATPTEKFLKITALLFLKVIYKEKPGFFPELADPI